MTEEVKKLELRLRRVEAELRELRRSVEAHGKDDKRSWIDKIAGTFENDKAFEEIVRLGKKIREADRPRKRRK